MAYFICLSEACPAKALANVFIYLDTFLSVCLSVGMLVWYSKILGSLTASSIDRKYDVMSHIVIAYFTTLFLLNFLFNL